MAGKRVAPNTRFLSHRDYGFHAAAGTERTGSGVALRFNEQRTTDNGVWTGFRRASPGLFALRSMNNETGERPAAALF